MFLRCEAVPNFAYAQLWTGIWIHMLPSTSPTSRGVSNCYKWDR